MKQWIQRSILLCLVLTIAVMLLRHPIATNDGPVHLAFSNQILHQHDPSLSLQHGAYLVEMKPDPNLAVYLLMAGLMKLFPVGLAEAIVQFLCLAGPVCAAYFAIYMIEPKNTWLAIFVLPISFSQMFFLGLYNHCMSTAAFFLVIGTYFWTMKAPSVAKAALLAGSLTLTFFCHASGFMMSVIGILTLVVVEILICRYREKHLLPTLKKHLHVFCALMAPFPLVLLFLAGHRGNTVYDVKLVKRIGDFLKLHELSTNYPTKDRFAAFAVSAVLLIGVAVVAVRVVRNRMSMEWERRDEALAVLACFLVAVVVMLAFPDTMGGGWTHFRRFEVFPYYWAVLFMAFDTIPTLVASGLMTAGTSAAIALMVSTAVRQEIVRHQMEPLMEADRLIGNHCTVLPVVSQTRTVKDYGLQDWMLYEPFFESASRLELDGDRVVLFNYLARLPSYPVHFRDSMEPQSEIFRWQPQERKVAINYVDVNNFERNSGLRVDYMLVWGKPEKSQPILKDQIQEAIKRFDPIYTSSGGLVTLYQRRGGLNPMCAVNPGALTAQGVDSDAEKLGQ